ncbi:unnamed protein product [Ophioblennius macclurei]
MSWTMKRCFVTLAILFLWRVDEMSEACSCSGNLHLQSAFCSSPVVIRAKVVGKEEVESGNDVYGNPVVHIKYHVKQLKMFKGPSEDIDAFYTGPTSSVCGVTLEATTKKEYLITGKLKEDGTMHVTLCDFVEPWDDLSDTQKKNLIERYQMGCDCKITRCSSVPCEVTGSAECLWTDWILERLVNGRQAKEFVCLMRRDQSCAWHKGSESPKRAFLDTEDP